MSQKKAKEARRAGSAQAPKPRSTWTRWTNWKGVLIGFAALALLGASFVIPKLANDKQTGVGQGHSMAGLATGDGPAIGSAPQFVGSNVITGQTISSQTLRGQKTLLFFSEGVMCQACLEQIRDIDQVGTELAKLHIRLVSITPDSTAELKQAIGQYGITSPMISDASRSMSNAFNMLGKGMHADTPGHAFVLIDRRGTVLWQRDYYQPPYRLMYVKPARLLHDIATS